MKRLQTKGQTGGETDIYTEGWSAGDQKNLLEPSVYIIHEAKGHFQTSFEKDKQLFLHYKLTQRFTQFKYLHVTF